MLLWYAKNLVCKMQTFADSIKWNRVADTITNIFLTETKLGLNYYWLILGITVTLSLIYYIDITDDKTTSSGVSLLKKLLVFQ